MSGSNPLLINPANPTATTVPELPRFPGMTPAYPLVFREAAEYYICTMPNHHFCRPDGKKLAFVFGTLCTKDEYDIQYLENEITSGNVYVRKASSAEIEQYHMRIDPQGTMENKLTPQIEQKVRAALDAELRATLEQRLSSMNIELSTEQREALLSSMNTPAPDVQATSQQAALDRLDVNTPVESMKPNLANRLQGIVGTDRIPNAAL